MILENQHNLTEFRRAIRDWILATVPSDWEQKLNAGDDAEYERFQRWWMAERNKVGLATPHWPKEYGGAGLSLAHQIVIADEMARLNAPPLDMYIVSLNHIHSTLIPYGTPEQKTKYLPGIARGDVWCQGFSEPGAGSDLASLQCRAERKGDHYLINGQKIWSSNSMYAHYCILLARTDPSAPKHSGISFFLMDMQAPGVEIRPIRQANGRAEFGEIFLDNVKIPAENLVGPENSGWKVAQSTLAAERGVLAFEGAERQRYWVEKFYKNALESNAPWLNDDEMRREFMSLFARTQAGRRLIRKLLRENQHGQTGSSLTPAFVKLSGTDLRQEIASFMVRTIGLESQYLEKSTEASTDGMTEYLTSFGGIIAAGSNEIMRNIIAERGLGMPRN